MDSVLYYIWLSLRLGAGSEAPSFLLSHFSSAKEIYEADEAALEKVLPGRHGMIATLCDKDLDTAKKVLEYCQRANVGIITLDSAIYPERLRSIHAKPIVLYYKGSMPNIDEHVLISCVGTRKCSDKGMRLAYKLGADLADAGTIVVSGMALGVDSMCARGALSVKGHTIAVLGCGIDRVYPQENKELMKAIIENGTVITEYAPGMVPNGKHFPVRNRIISGLSLGTVVVEAGKGSGALITAEHARKQGRDVFAFPGDVDNQFCAGTNELISDGAKMVRCAADILVEYEGLWHKRIFTGNIKKNKYYTGEDLPPEAPVTVKEYSAEAAKKSTAPKASAPAAIVKGEPRVTQEEFVRAKAEAERRDVFEEVFDFSKLNLAPETRDFTGITDYEKMVWEHINGAMTSDEIAQSIGKATGEPADLGAVLSALTTLEIEGYCESMPGGLFKRLD